MAPIQSGVTGHDSWLQYRACWTGFVVDCGRVGWQLVWLFHILLSPGPPFCAPRGHRAGPAVGGQGREGKRGVGVRGVVRLVVAQPFHARSLSQFAAPTLRYPDPSPWCRRLGRPQLARILHSVRRRLGRPRLSCILHRCTSEVG